VREELIQTEIYQEASALVNHLTKYIRFLNKGPSAAKVFQNISMLEDLETSLDTVHKIVVAQRQAIVKASVSPPLLGMPED